MTGAMANFTAVCGCGAWAIGGGAIAADGGGKPAIVVATNEAARGRGLKAGALVRVGAQTLGGGGGGKDDIAQGGGQDPARIDAALAAVQGAVEAAVAAAP
mgnify:CR=1 FL=1